MRDPKDNGHLIIDPDAAPVIRKIYDFALDGMGNMRIAKKLLEEKNPITRVKENSTGCQLLHMGYSKNRPHPPQPVLQGRTPCVPDTPNGHPFRFVQVHPP